jgi:general secretion pathway protein D
VEDKNKLKEKVFKINYVKLSEMVKFLNKLKSPQGKIIANNINNSIIVYDTVGNLIKIENMIKSVDVPDARNNVETRVFTLKYAQAQELLNILNNVKSPNGKLSANSSANIIVAIDTRKSIEKMSELIQKLDIPSFESRQHTFIYNVKYGEASDILNILQSDAFAGSVAKDLKITSDARTNSLILTGSKESINKTLHYIEQLDVRTKQVTIVAKIIEVTLDNDHAKGVNLNMLLPYGTKEKTVAEENRIGFNTFDSLGDYTSSIKFGTLEKEQVEAFYQSLATSSDAKVISNPTITTLDNQEAKILIGEKIPYEETTTSDGNTSSTINFKDVGITLTVKPKISPDRYITLKIHPEISQQNGTTTKGEPIIGTTEADTNVIIKDGETLVIGGLIKNNRVKTVVRMPLLSKIPLLGRAFRSVRYTLKRIETIVLITPHIIENYDKNRAVYLSQYKNIKRPEEE